MMLGVRGTIGIMRMRMGVTSGGRVDRRGISMFLCFSERRDRIGEHVCDVIGMECMCGEWLLLVLLGTLIESSGVECVSHPCVNARGVEAVASSRR